MDFSKRRDFQEIEDSDLEYFKKNPNEISFERKPYPGEFNEVPHNATIFKGLLGKTTWVVLINATGDLVVKIPVMKEISRQNEGAKGFRVSR